jgi:hypothetical protein
MWDNPNRISIHDVIESQLDNKVIKHAFAVYDDIYIGFTDGTWIGIVATTSPDSGDANLRDAPELQYLVELWEGFQWDIVTEFEQAGIITDGTDLRAQLKERRIKFLQERLAEMKRVMDSLNEQLGELLG